MRTLLGLYRRGSRGSGGTVGILIMRCPEVWGGGIWGACLGVIGFFGEGICGAYRTHFLSPGQKTWYLNYALYGSL